MEEESRRVQLLASAGGEWFWETLAGAANGDSAARVVVESILGPAAGRKDPASALGPCGSVVHARLSLTPAVCDAIVGLYSSHEAVEELDDQVALAARALAATSCSLSRCFGQVLSLAQAWDERLGRNTGGQATAIEAPSDVEAKGGSLAGSGAVAAAPPVVVVPGRSKGSHVARMQRRLDCRLDAMPQGAASCSPAAFLGALLGAAAAEADGISEDDDVEEHSGLHSARNDASVHGEGSAFGTMTAALDAALQSAEEAAAGAGRTGGSLPAAQSQAMSASVPTAHGAAMVGAADTPLARAKRMGGSAAQTHALLHAETAVLEAACSVPGSEPSIRPRNMHAAVAQAAQDGGATAAMELAVAVGFAATLKATSVPGVEDETSDAGESKSSGGELAAVTLPR